MIKSGEIRAPGSPAPQQMPPSDVACKRCGEHQVEDIGTYWRCRHCWLAWLKRNEFLESRKALQQDLRHGLSAE
jgi:rubredoxin